MAANAQSMAHVLDEIEHVDESTKANAKSQEAFWEVIFTRRGYYNSKSNRIPDGKALRLAVAYVLRNMKKEEYNDVKAEKAMNLFFKIGRDMLKDSYLSEIEAGEANAPKKRKSKPTPAITKTKSALPESSTDKQHTKAETPSPEESKHLTNDRHQPNIAKSPSTASEPNEVPERSVSPAFQPINKITITPIPTFRPTSHTIKGWKRSADVEFERQAAGKRQRVFDPVYEPLQPIARGDGDVYEPVQAGGAGVFMDEESDESLMSSPTVARVCNKAVPRHVLSDNEIVDDFYQIREHVNNVAEIIPCLHLRSTLRRLQNNRTSANEDLTSFLEATFGGPSGLAAIIELPLCDPCHVVEALIWGFFDIEIFQRPLTSWKSPFATSPYSGAAREAFQYAVQGMTYNTCSASGLLLASELMMIRHPDFRRSTIEPIAAALTHCLVTTLAPIYSNMSLNDRVISTLMTAFKTALLLKAKLNTSLDRYHLIRPVHGGMAYMRSDEVGQSEHLPRLDKRDWHQVMMGSAGQQKQVGLTIVAGLAKEAEVLGDERIVLVPPKVKLIDD